MTHRDPSTPVSRRHLLVLGASGLALAAMGCDGEKKSSGDGATASGKDAAKSCGAPVDAKSKQLRQTLQYKEKAEDPAKRCDKCAQYVTGQFGECGGCKLFAGPVQPGGSCLSFAPQSGAPAASSG